MVSRDRSRAIIVLRNESVWSNELKGLTNKIESWARAKYAQGASAQTTESFVLLNDASDEVADSQLSSLAIALVSIYLMMVCYSDHSERRCSRSYTKLASDHLLLRLFRLVGHHARHYHQPRSKRGAWARGR